MARPNSLAVGGYIPAPIEVMQSIAGLVSLPAATTENRSSWNRDEFAVMDPCAGEGDAILALTQAIFSSRAEDALLYLCEIEQKRFKALEKKKGTVVPYHHFHAVNGDAFRIAFERAGATDEPTERKRGASLAYINPPFHDYGRIEAAWLERFAPVLVVGGVLLFVDTYKSLAACAPILAREFNVLACYRFNDEGWEYKRVVLVATKRPRLLLEDDTTRNQVEKWAADHLTIPILPTNPTPIVTIPQAAGFSNWQITPIDLTSLLPRVRIWHTTDRGSRLTPTAGILPDRHLHDLLSPTFPLATPPRAAHIAAGIAAGIFNGARISPDNPASGLPDLLIKGTYAREFVTVEEKENKDGDVVGQVQVQQPRLTIVVLDLSTLLYHTIKNSTEVTGTREVGSMTTADLLTSYGRGLMATMLAGCPVLHDPANPAHEIPLPALKRPLYRAQAHAVMATIKLLGGPTAAVRERRGKCAFILGEIGSGKTQCALAVGLAIGARRQIVLCPPHLLDGWRDQIAAVLGPAARVTVLSHVRDVDSVAADSDPTPIIAIVSREKAKLGHAWLSVSPHCPRCGALVPEGDLAKKRAQCESSAAYPMSPRAHIAYTLGELLLSIFPKQATIKAIFRGRVPARMKQPDAVVAGERWAARRLSSSLHDVANRLFSLVITKIDEHSYEALSLLLWAIADDAAIEKAAMALYQHGEADPAPYGEGVRCREWARYLALLLPARGEVQERVRVAMMTMAGADGSYGAFSWDTFDVVRAEIEAGKLLPGFRAPYHEIVEGHHVFRKHRRGSAAAALMALEVLCEHSSWREEKCGEFLYQASAELEKDGEVVQTVRRYPIATYIAKRYPRLFDFFILDECHEASGAGSAQGHAAHRLMGLGMPTVLLTGSVMNGYAKSLFTNQWAADPDFRAEFDQNEIGAFERTYGYLKQYVDLRDAEGNAPVDYGSVTDRIESTNVRTIGSAPGVLPLFILRYLLKRAVTLHKADLALELPAHSDVVVRIQPDAEMKRRLDRLQSNLVAQIKRDRYSEELSGKLWGQMAELPSYLDRCTADTGNRSDGFYAITYPESVGGRVVIEQEPFSASYITPKEKWMLDTVAESIAAGRRVLVFAHHECVLPRLVRLIEERMGWTRGRCPLLLAKKVPAGKRQEWIDRYVIGAGADVLVVNPIAVQTGLNNLVHFQLAVWMENPACNPIVKRQADGRIDRIGKIGPTDSIFPVYENTLQENLHQLLMHKVGVSIATDGLDAESALSAAGVGEGGAFDALSIGRQLFRIIEDGTPRGLRVAEKQVVVRVAAAPLLTPPPPTAPTVARRKQLSLF